MPGITVRPATREDIEAFSGERLPVTVMALAGEVDGRIVGIGGLARVNGWLVGFCDLSEEGRRYKMAIVKAARRILATARSEGRQFVYAWADPTEPNATRWLQSLGFVAVNESGLFKWRA